MQLKGSNVADELPKFAKEHEITDVIFGKSAHSRWEIIWKGSVINRFLREVHDAAVHVVPRDQQSDQLVSSYHNIEANFYQILGLSGCSDNT